MYYIVELQTNDGKGAYIVKTKDDRNEALSAFHSVLAFAATSEVDYHACAVLDEQGRYVARECFVHIQQPEPEEAE